jgi:hypothetical protein
MGQFPGRWFSDNTLRGFDVSINLGTRVIDIRCVEQNPNKLDNRGNLKWSANLARQGHKMMWVIDRNGGFLGRLRHMGRIWQIHLKLVNYLKFLMLPTFLSTFSNQWLKWKKSRLIGRAIDGEIDQCQLRRC